MGLLRSPTQGKPARHKNSTDLKNAPIGKGPGPATPCAYEARYRPSKEKRLVKANTVTVTVTVASRLALRWVAKPPLIQTAR